ncbi:MAG: hypothetical protein ACRD3E_17150, partial [Terriglobales bacterium]
ICTAQANETAGHNAGKKIYAQELVDQAIVHNPGVLVLMMHVTPPGKSENVVVASNIGRIGKKGDEDDLEVIRSGKPKLEVNKTGDHFEVELPLQDLSQRTIGALGVVFPYKKGEDQQAFARKATAIRDQMRRRITTAASLMDPADWDTTVPKNTYAQQLVDRALANHPDILILAMHVTPPKKDKNVILASNIGRIGKVADEDDLDVINTGKPKLEVNSAGDRFEDELGLEDSSGKRIGALGVVYAYHNGVDKVALQKKAEQVRDELRKQIPSVDRLCEKAR